MINIGMITVQDLINARFESEKENLIDNNRFIVYNTYSSYPVLCLDITIGGVPINLLFIHNSWRRAAQAIMAKEGAI